ncbi:hypothetical protein ANCCEY_10880 [Ancylostoma ceylanicum]|uniref:Reverse transcriptase domain-containing protein n=2 Tax=Ancylostoma ceylanicum TaxID=53326 RepID=A0A0D6LFQ8_9BILA|nr:hypothetical protein ANCCEY_10880 [Ancylostoma ceylanicum]EYB84935.1 hypothetical protein Y032_0307g2032 [Ancylostoma ceylanicum]
MTISSSTSGEGFDKATLCRRNYSPPPSRTSCKDYNGTTWECELTAGCYTCCYADDIVLITTNISQAERMLADFDDACGKIGPQLNLTKTMFMING